MHIFVFPTACTIAIQYITYNIHLQYLILILNILTEQQFLMMHRQNYQHFNINITLDIEQTIHFDEQIFHQNINDQNGSIIDQIGQKIINQTGASSSDQTVIKQSENKSSDQTVIKQAENKSSDQTTLNQIDHTSSYLSKQESSYQSELISSNQSELILSNQSELMSSNQSELMSSNQSKLMSSIQSEQTNIINYGNSTTTDNFDNEKSTNNIGFGQSTTKYDINYGNSTTTYDINYGNSTTTNDINYGKSTKNVIKISTIKIENGSQGPLAYVWPTNQTRDTRAYIHPSTISTIIQPKVIQISIQSHQNRDCPSSQTSYFYFFHIF